MKTLVVVVILGLFVGASKGTFLTPPAGIGAPPTKTSSSSTGTSSATSSASTATATETCDSDYSIKYDLTEIREYATEILVVLDRIELKQSEVTSLADSLEKLTTNFNDINAALNTLLGQECCSTTSLPEAPTATAPTLTTGDNCVRDCYGVADGDYQSCDSCHVYVTCSGGITHPDRPCAENYLVWDDDLKRCEWWSNTCQEPTSAGTTSLPEAPTATAPTAPTAPSVGTGTGPTTTGDNCVRDCAGLADGDYQSCESCHVYVSCSGGVFYPDRPCAENYLVWDDDRKRCDYTSPTCTTPHAVDEGSTTPATTGSRCVSDCTSVADLRDYQSCGSCHEYIHCINGKPEPRSCPGNNVWDDQQKACLNTSTTCGAGATQGSAGSNPCVSDCTNMASIDYQSCTDCTKYLTCSNGIPYDNRPCPANLVWDDIQKRCEYTSPTCPLLT